MSKNKTLILSEADAVTLFTNGSLTKDGVTVQEADAIVFVPDNSVQWADVGSGANKVAQRNASGNLETGTPTDSDDAANKKYVDDKVANFVTTNTDQTISGVKTFSAAPVLNNNIGLQWKNSSGTAVDVLQFNTNNNLVITVPGGTTTINSTFKPHAGTDNTFDLGTYVSDSNKARWRNLYLSGNLSDGTNSVSIANIANKNNYLPLTGGTLYSTSADVLTVKRNNVDGGALIAYKNKNQDANLWRVGMGADENFGFSYSSDSGSTSARNFTITASGDVRIRNNLTDGNGDNSVSVANIASKTYVSDAIAAAITTALNTPV